MVSAEVALFWMMELPLLVMELPIRDRHHGEVLARAILRRFAEMPPLPAPDKPARIASLRVDVPRFAPGTSDAQVASTVATALHRAVAQALGPVAGPRRVGATAGRPNPVARAAASSNVEREEQLRRLEEMRRQLWSCRVPEGSASRADP